ncbi:MAG: YihY/virulence factor BrkB family protein [Cyclobacteriaceae bacterium]|nr:YihY/virulence factor BrkB family protein [Cyclobacteriaceae bacterium]
MKLIHEFIWLLKKSFTQWVAREPFNNSVIIAYYTIFSLPGLLIIIINIASSLYDKQEITNQITNQIQRVMGGDTARDIESILGNISKREGSAISSIVGIATLLFGATGVFYQLQQMLNKIWQVKPKVKTRHKLLELIRDRIFSFGLILVVGFLLLVSLVLSAALSAVSTWVSIHLSESLNVVFKFLDIIISLGVITFLFAAIYKYLPDVKLEWKEVAPGAFLTAILFVATKFALGFYFGQSDLGSTYGAAGSIILIMLWVSYAGMILLFGAEFTEVYISKHGRNPKPTSAAVSTAS